MTDNDNQVQSPGISKLLQLSGTKKNYLAIAGLLCAIGSIAKMMIYYFIYLVIIEIVECNGVVSNIPEATISSITMWAAISLLASLILKSAGSACSHIAAFNILYELRMQLSKKLAKLPMGYFDAKASGSIKKIMSDDVERIEQFVAHHIVDFVSGVVTPLVTLVFMFIVDWRLALAALVSVPIAMAVGRSLFANKSSQDLSDKYQDAISKMSSSTVEYVNGMSVIKTFAEGKNILSRLEENISSTRTAAMKWANRVKNLFLLFNLLLPASILFIFPLSVYLMTNPSSYKTMLISVLFFFVIGTNFAEPMKQLLLLSGVMRKITYGMECIDAILKEKELPVDNKDIEITNSSVAFKDVFFTYDTTEVLKNISFYCHPNTVTALVGPSGAGKSTVAKLIARFWDTTSGQVLISGNDVKDYSNDMLMKQVSFVFQDVCILSDTIEENIRMGNRDASFDDVVKAAKSAQIHDFIELLPFGYDTKIGDGGVHLSGGEEQRISIARVFLKNTPIIVLDEATAYADAENEAHIQLALSKLAKDKTVIVVAHRLSTISNADNIIVIDKGTIAEEGTHDKLLANNGLYAKLWEAMSLSKRWKLSSTEEVVS